MIVFVLGLVGGDSLDTLLLTAVLVTGLGIAYLAVVETDKAIYRRGLPA